ncbi:MAG: hypothetical protein RIE77_13745 [Phycisphaerales bacterium]
MRIPLKIAFPALFCCLWGSVAAAVHPQDGPHADLRLAIGGEGVTFQVGLNLAFMDEAVGQSRESIDQIDPVEAEALEQAMRAFMASDVVVEIDGRIIQPDVQSYEFFDEPEPWMIGVFPKYGARALIRCAITARYDATDPQVVKVTWPTYPRDLVAVELEGMTGPDGQAPFMVLEALVQTSDGTVDIAQFSTAKPTIEWYADQSGDARYAAIPPTPIASEPLRLSLLGPILFLVGLQAAVIVIRKKKALAGAAILVAAVASGIAAAIVMPLLAVPIPGTGGGPALPSDEQAAAIFEPLHDNLYKAFDYGSEGEIYDALERSVSGPLLESLYTQVYNSLVQAEQGGMLGIVTGVDPIDLSVRSIATDDEGRARIEARHRWSVEGTVYHWGHSHTRVHEYEADYTIAALDQGWRIVGQRMLEQRRVDEDGVIDTPERDAF